MKILVFGASNSKNSINKKFAHYASTLLHDNANTLLDLNDFEVPLYGIDYENENGIPSLIHDFSKLIEDHDAVIISLAEHNSNFTVAFKNITDWASRLEGKVWKNKKMFLLSTSPGARGGQSVMQIALNNFPYAGADIKGHFSLPSFNDNFNEKDGITNPELLSTLKSEIVKLMN